MKGLKKGFSLIELIIVLMIIALFTSVAIPKYQAIHRKAKENTLKTIISNIQIALESYYLTNGQYPSGTTSSINEIESELVTAGYLSKMNKNPFTGHLFSLSDISGLATYSSDQENYTIEGYGYKNENIIFSATN